MHEGSAIWFHDTGRAWPVLLLLAALIGLGGLMLVGRRPGGFLACLSVALFAIASWWVWNIEQRTSEVRLLAARAWALEMQALAPGSIFACLHEIADEALKSACERVLFQSPQAIAAALQYRESQLEIFEEGLRLGAVKGALKQPLNRVQRMLERDQFGITAYVLATRRGCSEVSCDSLVQFGAATRVRAHLQQGTFQRRLDETFLPTPAVAARSPTPDPGRAVIDPRPVGGGTPPSKFKPLGEQYSLPSAASIPPISIMNDEPSTATGNDGANAETSDEQRSGRSPSKPTARNAARGRPVPAPMSLTPR
jgi:hypothetical protein